MKFKNESGRSMIEMLGVLAIIGVLSIGGIAGYTLSMRRYRANNVLDAAAKYSLIAYGNCQQTLLNGQISALENCNAATYAPTYANAGVGDLPAGASDIQFVSMISMGGSTGSDATLVTVTFTGSDAQRLCQAALSTTGTKVPFEGGPIQNVCADEDDPKLDVIIRQN